MSEAVTLDGVRMDLDVDRIDVDLAIPGLAKTEQGEVNWDAMQGGVAMEPVARFEDGTVIYFQCPPEGEPPSRGYSVQSPRPHQWSIALGEEAELGQTRKVATLHVSLT